MGSGLIRNYCTSVRATKHMDSEVIEEDGILVSIGIGFTWHVPCELKLRPEMVK